jgi:hypothetical protein
MRYIKFAPAFVACLALFPLALAVYVLAELWELLVVEITVPLVSGIFIAIEDKGFRRFTKWAKVKRKEFDAAGKQAAKGEGR